MTDNEFDIDDAFEDDWSEETHRSGVVVVVGRPNVGKSTLLNAILGQKIAIVTDKPQTTRKNQLGIFTHKDGQIMFVDTPGLHKPHHKLGEYMVDVATDAIKDADLILWVMDASEKPTRSDEYIAETLNQLKGTTPIILALNKSDLLEVPSLAPEEHLTLIEHDMAQMVSAQGTWNVRHLTNQLLERLPLGPRYYPADQVSEVSVRFIAAETVREKIILNTEQEIPHAVAVEVDEFKERSDDMTYISAIIYVERDSQKGIIIGKGGAMIKKIGKLARQELAILVGTKVYLDLRVKVLKNWRSDETLMKRLGYKVLKSDDR